MSKKDSVERKPDAVDEQIILLRKSGKSLREIGEVMGISHQAVKKRLNKQNIGTERVFPGVNNVNPAGTGCQFTKIDRRIIENWNPELTKRQNLQNLEAKGLASLSYGYRRLEQNDALQCLINRLNETFVKRITPKAATILESRLQQVIDGEPIKDEIAYIKEGLKPLGNKEDLGAGPQIQLNILNQLGCLGPGGEFSGTGSSKENGPPQALIDLVSRKETDSED